LRFFNVAGADPDCELGEDYSEQTHIIPLAIQAGFTAKQFKLFGNDYNTPDGTCIRDYIHVMDVANAHLNALQKIQNDIDYDSFNIASGNGLSNNEILQEVQKHTGAMDIVSSPKREGDPDTLLLISVGHKTY
jgi:UDP-glucose 4-epimerase